MYNSNNHNNLPENIDIPITTSSASTSRQLYDQNFLHYGMTKSEYLCKMTNRTKLLDDGFFNLRETTTDIEELMNDSRFMAYLGCPLSNSLPTIMEPIFEKQLSTTMINNHDKKKRIHSNLQTKIGKCEHPKHILYRQENYTLMSSTSTAHETSFIKTIPRRGRPPKGSKPSDVMDTRITQYPVMPSSSPVKFYPIVELTVRPLPKRLEKVVGKSNIKVCLTCLKRSDTDLEYVHSKLYIPPQQMHKKK